MIASFVIPTLGRATLDRALASVLAQTDPDWEAVVVCDGWMRIDEGPDDERIRWYGGDFKSAGITRNAGMDIATGDWVGFLDDDDIVLPTYVEHLREHALDYPWAEVIVFRMDDPNWGVLPRPSGHLHLGGVGISFAIRADIAKLYRFAAEETYRGFHEDWDMISRIRDDHRIFLSPHTDYVVQAHR